MCTKCTVPAAATGSAEQQATDGVNVDDPENVDPDEPAKAPKNSKKSCQTHVTREQISTRSIIVIL